nr:rhodanese-like domain-containing protein [uncultured Acinetobacter sp.]
MIRKIDITNFSLDDNILVDVRNREEYAKGHILGSINIPYDSLNLDNTKIFSKYKVIYIICGGGSTALNSAEKLQQIAPEFDYVVLMGGIRIAKEIGLPLEI